jgi:RNA polymerase sigma-70 factor (ECF subfamily)
LAQSDDPVAEAAGGSEEAIRELFERHWEAAWDAAFKILGVRVDADDVAQEAFLASIRRLDSFDNRSSYRTWLVRIAINRAIDVARRRRRVTPVEPISEFVSPAPTIDAAALRQDVYRAVHELPLMRRIPIVLRYWLGLTPEEIADVTGSNLGTVHSRLARGLAELRKELRGSDAID